METLRSASRTAEIGVPGLAERMHDFRSLGGNCEFGFVQRYCGAEPSGLFRFSAAPLDQLVAAIATDFAHYGAASDLHLIPTETGVYYCRSRSHEFWSNTQKRVDEVDHDALLESEYGRVAYLKTKMLADLKGGAKILVRKVGVGETEADFARLAEAVWRHGPSTLLRVTEAVGDQPIVPIRRTGDRVLEGSVRRFAPDEEAWSLDLESWVRLCDAAYAADRRIPEALLKRPTGSDAMRLPHRTMRHKGRHRDPGLSAFTKLLDPSRFDPEKPYVFSAWVRIPAEASPERVFAVMGRERLGWRDADLTIRGRWQRVWAAGRVRARQVRPSVGVGLVGKATDRFQSRDWHLEEGPIPDWTATPPPEPALPTLIRYLSGRRD